MLWCLFLAFFGGSILLCFYILLLYLNWIKIDIWFVFVVFKLSCKVHLLLKKLTLTNIQQPKFFRIGVVNRKK